MLHSDLSMIARGGYIYMTRCLSDFGITGAEVMTLTYLYEHANPRQEDISNYFMLDKGTVAKTMQKLEKKDMIERLVNERDQREKVIHLTEKGYCVKDVCMNLTRLWHETMFNGIAPEEIKTFESVLERISANVASSIENWGTACGKETDGSRHMNDGTQDT